MSLLDALAWRLSSRQDAWRSSHQRRPLSLFTTIDAPPGQRQVTLPATVLQEAAKAPLGRPVCTSLTQVPAAVARTMEAVRPALRNMALLILGCSEAIPPKHWAWAQPASTVARMGGAAYQPFGRPRLAKDRPGRLTSQVAGSARRTPCTMRSIQVHQEGTSKPRRRAGTVPGT